MAGRNIDIVLCGLADALRSQDPEHIASFLAPGLVWEGLGPGLRCEGREQAMTLIRNRFRAAPLAVEAVDAIDAGDDVVVGVRGPGFNAVVGDRTTVGRTYHVFTFCDGQVTRWRVYATRAEALTAAGVSEPASSEEPA